MSRSISAWIEVPPTAPAAGASRSRPPRSRAIRLTIATVPEPDRAVTWARRERIERPADPVRRARAIDDERYPVLSGD